LAAYKDQDVILGVRPENFNPKAEGAFAAATRFLKGKLAVVEPLGDKMDVYMASAKHSHIVCRVDSHVGVKEGQELPMYVDINRVHVFEAGSNGKNLTLDQGNGG